MNSFAISCLFTATLTVVLGLFVYLGNRRRRSNLLWLIVSGYISIWIFGLLGTILATQPSQALFWQRVLYLGTSFLPAGFYHYSVQLFGKEHKYRRQIIEIYAISAVYSILVFTKLFIDHVTTRTSFGYWPVSTGPVYPFFLAFFLLGMSYSLALVYREYRRSTGVRSQQLILLFVGTLIGFIGGSTNFVLDFNLNIYPIGNFFVSFYAIFMAYAIIRHGLMNIRLIILRTISFSLVVLIISSLVASIAIVIPDTLNVSIGIKGVLTIAASMFIVLVVSPLKQLVGKVTDKFFYKGKIDYQILVKKLTSIISLELDLQKLIDDLEKGLVQGLRVDKSFILLRENTKDKTNRFQATIEHELGKEQFYIENNSPLINYVREQRHLSLLESLERKIEDTSEGPTREKEEGSKSEFEKLGVALVAPIFSEDHLVAVLTLGPKLSGDSFSNDDVQLIEMLTPQIGSAIEKAKLYDEVRQSRENLQVKVNEATKELRVTNSQLEFANKHLRQLDQAKSEFVSIASHQLRTPMTGIMGYLSMMTQGDFGQVKPEHNDILVKLLSESQRMIRLINQFLNVTKIEAGKLSYQKAPVKIAELIAKEVYEVQKTATDKKLKIEIKLPKQPLPIVMADPDKLQDVILNLIDNAIKYTAKGTITIGADVQDQMLRVWVQDSGIGIKPEDAPELFNKFVRGTGIAQIHPDGSGLGLFIAKSVIDAHDGKIWAASKGEGKGSTFQFTLPLKSPSPAVSPKKAI